MANFGTMTAGKENYFNHPCFAWLGQADRVWWDAIRFYPGDMRATQEDVELFFGALLASSLRHEEGFSPQLVTSGRNVRCIEIPLEGLGSRPFWQVLRILKFGFKLFGYSSTTFKAFIENLKKGANFQVVSFALAETYGYHYPAPQFPKGDEEVLFNFLEGGPMVDLTKWSGANRPLGNELFYKENPRHLGASGACHPLIMEWNDAQFILADDDLNNRRFDLETFEKNLERIHKEWAERKGGVK